MNPYVQAFGGVLAGAITLYLLDRAVQRLHQRGPGATLAPAPAPKPTPLKRARVAAGLAIQKGSWSLAGVGVKVAKKVAGA